MYIKVLRIFVKVFCFFRNVLKKIENDKKKLRIMWMEQQRKVLMMKNKSCFWLLFLPGILLIRLIFSAAFWYVIGCVVLGIAVAFFIYIVFIRMFIVNRGEK